MGTGKNKVGLILLAAGASTRMGSPKQLLTYRGKSLLLHAVQTARTSSCDPIVVVLGAHKERIVPVLAGHSVDLVINKDWAHGMAGSIRSGLQHLLEIAPDSQAVVLMLVDQPLVSTGLLNSLIDSWKKSDKGICASQYEHILGVPALFDRRYFGPLARLAGQEGARKLIRAYKADCIPTPFPEGKWDIDTPQDYEALT